MAKNAEATEILSIVPEDTLYLLHRGLPVEIQPLGNSYVRDEFRRHKNCDEALASTFLREWTEYAMMLAKQLGLKGPKTAKPLGEDLKQEDLDKLRDEQVYQLYELMNAATGKKDKNEKET